ncbi:MULTISPECIES: hypothetical protein [Kitasatospora]|uniref:Uncharacterized protein n=1 Tax=Kitasatospora cathayae TaxID=3004092 RepID=A0ABY7PYK0_9ACTN|nr:hypothetical protein [Kitasatospora sp. HUAS 3-15]WBP85451.1 hypothetical protein O1G21_06025 [Kitasatospora sp. HUAS 3-15]
MTSFRAVVFDFLGVLTSNMVEVITWFENRERIAPGTFLRAWSDPRGQDLFRNLELGRTARRTGTPGSRP